MPEHDTICTDRGCKAHQGLHTIRDAAAEMASAYRSLTAAILNDLGPGGRAQAWDRASLACDALEDATVPLLVAEAEEGARHAAEVDDLARLLMEEWEKAEGKPVGISYVATFADMARAVIRARA